MDSAVDGFSLLGGIADFFGNRVFGRRKSGGKKARSQNLDAGNLFEGIMPRKKAGPKKRKKPKDVEFIQPEERNVFDANENEEWAHDTAREKGVLKPDHLLPSRRRTTRQPYYYQPPNDYNIY